MALSPYSSEAEHQSRKLGVVSSILTGGMCHPDLRFLGVGRTILLFLKPTFHLSEAVERYLGMDPEGGGTLLLEWRRSTHQKEERRKH